MIAWLFPGQGSQDVGMGRALCRGVAGGARRLRARRRRARLVALASSASKVRSSELTLTANTQPAIVTTSIATLAALRERCPTLPPPAFAAGHSLGEYSALVAARRARARRRRAPRARARPGDAGRRARGQGAMAAIMGVDAESRRNGCAARRRETASASAPRTSTRPGRSSSPATPRPSSARAQLAAEREAQGHPAQGERAVPLRAHGAGRQARCERASPTSPSGALAFPVVANVEALPNADPARVRGAARAADRRPVRWEQIDSASWPRPES